MRRLFLALAIAFSSLTLAPARAGGLLQDLFAPAPRAARVVYRYAPDQLHMRFVYDEAFRVSRRGRLVHRKAGAHRAVKAWSAKHKARPAHRASRTHSEERRVAAGALSRKSRVQAVATARRTVAPVQHVAKRARFQFTSMPTPAPRPAMPVETIHDDPTLKVGDAYMTSRGLRIYRGRAASAADRAAFVELRRARLGKALTHRLASLEHAAAPADYAPIRTRTFAASGPEAAFAATRRTSLDRRGRIIRVVGP